MSGYDYPVELLAQPNKDEANEQTQKNGDLLEQPMNEDDVKNHLEKKDEEKTTQQPIPPTSGRRKKQQDPKKSPSKFDPNFRGVTMASELKNIDGEWRLMTIAKFQPPSLAKQYLRKVRKLERKREVEEDDDSDEHAIRGPVRAYIEKHCASCNVKKTPLWRDAEDGTPLCNACGIRYKKYKIRCAQCWHIPKKDEFSPLCKFCGSKFQYSYPRVW